MRRLHPEPVRELSSDEWAAAYAFPRTPWVRGSMAATLDGAVAGADGKSGSISSTADRRLFPTLRHTADVILVGAGTVRDENYSASNQQMAIVTNRLGLSTSIPLIGDRSPDAPIPIVFTTEHAIESAPEDLVRTTEVMACGRETVDLAAAIAILVARGLGRIHCEGGPRLLTDLASASLLDELLLTITPRLAGSTHHLLNADTALGLRWHFTQVLEDEGSVFVRAQRPC